MPCMRGLRLAVVTHKYVGRVEYNLGAIGDERYFEMNVALVASPRCAHMARAAGYRTGWVEFPFPLASEGFESPQVLVLRYDCFLLRERDSCGECEQKHNGKQIGC